MSKIRVRRFDPRILKMGSTILLIGRRGSGKSTMMKDIAYHLWRSGRVDLSIGFSPTDISNNCLTKFMLPSLVYSSWREDVVERLIQIQRRQFRAGRGRQVVLIMDDIAYGGRKVFNSKVLRNIYMNGRHFGITSILAVQYAMDLPPAIRSNIDVVIAHSDPIVKSRHNLWEFYFGMFRTSHDFDRTMAACTREYGVIVAVNNNSQTNLITDSVFHYRAAMHHPPFKLCSPVYLRLHQKYYRPDLEFDDEESETAPPDAIDISLGGKRGGRNRSSDAMSCMTTRSARTGHRSTAMVPYGMMR